MDTKDNTNSNSLSGISDQSLIRLSRMAGVKSISNDSFDMLRDLINKNLDDIVKMTMISNNTKTIMKPDVVQALHSLGKNVTDSSHLKGNSCSK